MPEFKRLTATRVVAAGNTLDSVTEPSLRFAPDESLILAAPAVVRDKILAGDPHAIVISDNSFLGAHYQVSEALEMLERHCEWQPPARPLWPCMAQGAVAGIPTKLSFSQDSVLVVVQAPYLHDFLERTQ